MTGAVTSADIGGVSELMDVEWERVQAEGMPMRAVSLVSVDAVVKRLYEYLCVRSGEAPELVVDLVSMESDYQKGRPEEARARASKVISSATNSCALLLAHANHMVSSVAAGEAHDAYCDFLELYRRCLEGLGHPEDRVMHGMSLLCALHAEALLVATVFDEALIDEAIDAVDPIFRNTIGYLVGLRALRHGQLEKAAGILYAYTITTPETYALSQVSLNALLASTYTIEGLSDKALTHFSRAWELLEQTGIMMPLVSFDYLMFGTRRRFGLQDGSEDVKRMNRAVRRYNAGWFALRGLCGLPSPLEPLTPLECHTLGLAILGWSGKEIALYFQISINTVKHQLTGAYQKLGVSGRAAAREMVRNALVARPSCGVLAECV